MNRTWSGRLFIDALVILFPLAVGCNIATQKMNRQKNASLQMEIKLPDPVYKGTVSIEEVLQQRRSVRAYKNEPLGLKAISQLLRAAQGITDPADGGRTAPSAGALYPLELYLVTGNVDSLVPGVYHFLPAANTLQQIVQEDRRGALSAASFMQGAINRSAAVIVIAAEYSRTTKKYAERGIRYVHMEAGHAAQNICLQAMALKIGTVTMGAFKDSLVKQILNLPLNEVPLYLLPVGRKKE